MEAGQNGHGGAYHRLLKEVSEWLTRYFQRRLPAGDVDDAVQETLLAIHRRRHTFDPRCPLKPDAAQPRHSHTICPAATTKPQ